jgi:hypothetical protein
MNEIEESPGEGTRLDELARELPPPVGLEERVVARLAGRGLLTRRSRRGRWLLPLAAAAAGLAAGWLLHGSTTATPSPRAEAGLYLLVVHGESGEARPAAERVEAHRAWARELAASGRLVTAKKLASSGSVLDGGSTAPSRPLELDASSPSGFFLVRASSLAEAERLARSSPHVRWGGRLTVRPIDPV